MAFFLSDQVGDPEIVRENFRKIKAALLLAGIPVWGSIVGDMSDQADLIAVLEGKEDAIPAGTTSQYLRGDKTWQTLPSPGISSVSGTTNRISVSNGTVINISSAYVGQDTITTLGIITTGTWNGTAIASQYGGTGQASWAKGDMLYASGVNTLAKLSMATVPDGYVLTAASGLPVWAAASGGGSSLPDMTGNANKWLTTNGTNAMWAFNTGWSTSGNVGTDGGITNFIGTTDSSSFKIRTNNTTRAYVHGSEGGISIVAPYSTSGIVLQIGRASSSSPTMYITGGGNSSNDSAITNPWTTGYALVFGSPTNQILSITGTGVSVTNLTISGANLSVAQTVQVGLGSGKFTSTGGVIALEYASANTWTFGIRKSSSTYILTGDLSGNISIGSTGAGTSPASSTFTINSTTQGSIPAPRMTLTNWNSIATKVEGLQAWNNVDHGQLWYDGTGTMGFRYNRSTGKFQGYDGTNWIDLN